jgi:hypothetical protein
MKIGSITLSVFGLAVAAMISAGLAVAASEATYNPATAVSISGTITAVREVPAGQPLDGIHLVVKTKSDSSEIYLGPKSFLSFRRRITRLASGSR